MVNVNGFFMLIFETHEMTKLHSKHSYYQIRVNCFKRGDLPSILKELA